MSLHEFNELNIDSEIDWPEEVRDDFFDELVDEYDDDDDYDVATATKIFKLDPVDFDADSDFEAIMADDETDYQSGPDDFEDDAPDQPLESPAIVADVDLTVKVTKVQLAKAIFDDMFWANPPVKRKDILNAFIEEAGLTKAGASTYYQNFTKSLTKK
jgi:hypothetical protein